jgi:hypothetical protein
VNGQALHFYLAGINNQNFLMRDKETGTWWQQITGRAIFGPMKGSVLELVPSDELTFGEWKSETTGGQVLAPVPRYAKEYDPNWEPEVAKLPVVISFPGTELKSRDVVVGLTLDGASRAYPWDALVKQSPVVDRVEATPLLAVVGPDGKSFRIFISRIDGNDAEFFLQREAEGGPPAASSSAAATATTPASVQPNPPSATPGKPAAQPSADKPSPAGALQAPRAWTLVDTTTASQWNFQGCAIRGPAQGKCLDRVPALKDYWFDWRNYHPDTTVYKR